MQALASVALAVLPLAVATSITPGPNNAMLASSGARFGLVRTLPHIAGITFGFAAMMTAVGLAAWVVSGALPLVEPLVRTAGVLYLGWLAWRIASADVSFANAPDERPMGPIGAAAFQWVNPKGWAMVLGAMSAHRPPGPDALAAVVVIIAVFAGVGVVSSLAWTMLGRLIGRFLRTHARRRSFNLAMAALLVASLVPIVIGDINPSA